MDTDETTEPQIIILVRRKIKGADVETHRLIDLLTYKQAKSPGSVVECEINAMLEEMRFQP